MVAEGVVENVRSTEGRDEAGMPVSFDPKGQKSLVQAL
jgi:hypothetical protein